MKKIHHTILTIIAILCVSTVQSCSDKDHKTEPIYKVSVSDSEITLGVTQEQKTFTVISKINWEITAEGLDGTDGGWYTISTANGNDDTEITVDAKTNDTGEQRTAILIVEGAYNSVTVTITQAADGSLVLDVDKTSLSFTIIPTEPETFNVTAAAFGFDITTKDEFPEPQQGATPWYTITPTQADAPAEISVIATPNSTGMVRSVTIVVKSPTGKFKEVNVQQAADGDGILDVTPTILTKFEVVNAPTQTFKISTPFEWEITFEDKTVYTDPSNPAIEPEWASADIANGIGDKTITVTAKDNSTGDLRVGKFTITAVGKTKTVTITQDTDLNSTFDPKFLAWCLNPLKGNIDTDGNGLISINEAEAVTKIDCNNQSLTSLKGVSNFTNLTDLYCYENKLTELDVSANTKLTNLRCYNNHLTELDLSTNTELTWLSCGDNLLTELNLSTNTKLTALYCRSNPSLATIDIRNSSFEKLKSFYLNNIAAGAKVIVWSGFDIANKPVASDWQYDASTTWELAL